MVSIIKVIKKKDKMEIIASKKVFENPGLRPNFIIEATRDGNELTMVIYGTIEMVGDVKVPLVIMNGNVTNEETLERETGEVVDALAKNVIEDRKNFEGMFFSKMIKAEENGNA